MSQHINSNISSESHHTPEPSLPVLESLPSCSQPASIRHSGAPSYVHTDCFACRDTGLLVTASAALAAGGQADESSQETLAVVGRALIWPLESLAQRHRAHELLYNACELLLTVGLLDRQRLLIWMQQEVQEAAGALPADSFTFYVMET